MKTENKKGFTLIELLVAIAIVAVLAAIGFTLFQSSQASARDAKRRADVNAISTALETQFNAVEGTYPVYDEAVWNGWFADRVVPTDPLNTGDYQYNIVIPGTPANTKYTVCAYLENKGGNFVDNIAATPGSGDLGTHYCKRNQQE